MAPDYGAVLRGRAAGPCYSRNGRRMMPWTRTKAPNRLMGYSLKEDFAPKMAVTSETISHFVRIRVAAWSEGRGVSAKKASSQAQISKCCPLRFEASAFAKISSPEPSNLSPAV